MALWTLALLALFGAVHSQGSPNYKRVCYYTNWSQYRTPPGRFLPEDVDPHLCTHISFAFAVLNNQSNALGPFGWNDEDTQWAKGMYSRIMALRTANSSLKISLAVGEWNFGSEGFSNLVANSSRRNQFVGSTVEFLRKRNFDGLDLNWEYLGGRGGDPNDKINLIKLVQELKTAFEQDAASTGRDRLLLSAAVAAGQPTIDAGYDVAAFAREFDFINLMAYDLHRAWENITGIHAPLYPSGGPNPLDVTFNVEDAANYWVSLVPQAEQASFRRKLIIGVALYGRSFTLADPNVNGVNAPVSGPGVKGHFTGEHGFLSYFEICEMINKGGIVHWDEAQQVPYMVYNDQWVGYDNERSIRQKVRWMKENNFGGMMVWSLDLDSFAGQCNGQNWTLIRAINDELTANTTLIPINLGGSPSSTRSTRSTPQPPSSPAPSTTSQPRRSPSSSPSTPKARRTTPGVPSTPPQCVCTCPSGGPYTRPITTTIPMSTVTTAAPSRPATPPATPQPVTVRPTTPEPDICQKHLGILADPHNCTIFHQCAPGGIHYQMVCPSGQFFNTDEHMCHWPESVLDCNADGTRRPDVTVSTVRQAVVDPNGPTTPAAGRVAESSDVVCANRTTGEWADPYNCTIYHKCTPGGNYVAHCPTPFLFNKVFSQCDWPQQIPETECTSDGRSKPAP